MSIYDGSYFHLNKTFLRAMGLWPYDDWKRYGVRSIYLVLVLILSIPHVLGVILHVSNVDKLMEHLLSLLYLFGVFMKMLTVSVSDKKMTIMLDAIAENYALIVDFEERQILMESAQKGRYMTIIYGALIANSGTFFNFLPLYAPILDAISPLSMPRKRSLTLRGEYLMEDIDAHYWPIYLSEVSAVVLIVMIAVSVDTMYMACTQHSVGLFAIIKYRLQKLNQLVHNDTPRADAGYDAMRNIIRLHQRALEFTETLGNSYSQCFFALMLLHIVHLPVSSVCILVNIDEPVTEFRYGLSFICLAIHQFSLNWPAQCLTDASANLFVDAYCSEWYRSSPKTKKLLMIFLQRCMRPSIITAGGIVDMGMETFYSLMKKAVSYITVFASFR